MQTQAITALPDFDAVEVALTNASQSLRVMRQQHRRGLITEHELAERSFQGLITAMKDLARILGTMEGPVPERPWPLGTALTLSAPHQGVGIVIADYEAECTVRCADRDVTVPSAECEWAWHPEPLTQSIAQEAVWPSDTLFQAPSQ